VCSNLQESGSRNVVSGVATIVERNNVGKLQRQARGSSGQKGSAAVSLVMRCASWGSDCWCKRDPYFHSDSCPVPKICREPFWKISLVSVVEKIGSAKVMPSSPLAVTTGGW